MSYKSVHRDFLASLEEDSKLRALKYDAFRKLWHQLTPYIQIMSPRTDLCDTCQQLRNDLQFKVRKEEEAQDLLKKYKEHLTKAKLERNYYNKNTKLAEEHRKLVDQNYSLIGKVFYLSARKVHLFGIQDEAVREQINYVLDEDEIIGKGPNGTLSMVFDGIKRLNKVICGYYESIELNFMVPGHTKFKCDGSFGLIKKLYRKTTVDYVDHIVKVVKNSSTAGLNKAQCYENGKGFQYLDLNSVLGIFFKKLSGLQKYQHFVFEAARPGIVKTQLVANVLTPSPLDYKRQEYLYHNIRLFVRDEFKDITCPKPIYPDNEAKEYSKYHDGPLKPEEKVIFDSALLKPNNLTPDGRALFKSLLTEQRTNSVSYQLVNEIDYNKPIDKVVSQFEDVLFYESDYKYLLGIESRKAELEIYLDERAKKEKEIAGLRAKVTPNLVEKEEYYKTLISQI
ncbi:10730_t:CDS:2, partial [Ambispora leptoticha]